MEIKVNKPEVGVIVARFQTSSLTEAHVDLIKTVQKEHQKVLLFLGLSPAIGTRNNPLDLEMRRQMVQTYEEHARDEAGNLRFEENGTAVITRPFENINILYIKDDPSDDNWSRKLDAQIRDNLTPGQKPLLYGSRDSFIKHYTGKFPTQELISESAVSATKVRDQISKKTKNSREFREGVIWAVYNQYEKVHPTVDIAIVDVERQEIILGRKENETKFRFIGGFAAPKSRSYEEDAAREVEEETGIITKAEDYIYIGSSFVDDWRYRGECDKIKTTLFFVAFPGGDFKADDDIFEVKRFKIADLTEDMLVDTHKPLYHLFRKFVKKNSVSLGFGLKPNE